MHRAAACFLAGVACAAVTLAQAPDPASPVDAVRAGRDPRGVIRDPQRARNIPLPDMARQLNTVGIPLAEFQDDPLLKQRLKDFRHHYGQPPEVRRAFEEAMGIGR